MPRRGTTAVSPAARSVAASRSAPRRQRGLMAAVSGAIVITDLVGFTEFTAASGDDEAVRLLALQDDIVTTLLPDDARIVKELGDGLMIYFGEACDAVATMLDVLDAFSAAGDREE